MLINNKYKLHKETQNYSQSLGRDIEALACSVDVTRNEMRSAFCDSNIALVFFYGGVPEEAGTHWAKRNDMTSFSVVVKAMEGCPSTSNLL